VDYCLGSTPLVTPWLPGVVRVFLFVVVVSCCDDSLISIMGFFVFAFFSFSFGHVQGLSIDFMGPKET
jgi:hypothetical protein